MGLDVYLYEWKEDRDTWLEKQKEFEAKQENLRAKRIPNGYSNSSEQERADFQKDSEELALYMGLDVDGCIPDTVMTRIEINSAKYPEHNFKIGYMRSSYNSGGTNTVLRNLINTDLYEIFGVGHDDYYCQPELQWAYLRATEALSNFKSALENAGGCYVIEASYNPFITEVELLCGSQRQALDMYIKERESEKSFDQYSNRDSQYFMGESPPKVRAILPGFKDGLLRNQKEPCFYVVCQNEPSDEPNYYVQALEIVIEQIQWMIEHPNRDKLWMTWSG